MHKTSVSNLSVRFADGSVFAVRTLKPAEIYLSPVFIKFFTVIMVLVALIDRGVGEQGLWVLSGWYQVAAWGVLGATALTWFHIASFLTVVLFRQGLITTVYTPLIWVPIIIAIYPVGQTLIFVFTNEPVVLDISPIERTTTHLIAGFSYDFIFSSFVAPQHPAFCRRNETGEPIQENDTQAAPPAAPVVQPSTVDTGPETVQKQIAPEDRRSGEIQSTVDDKPTVVDTLKFGKNTFQADEILYIRSEDHYLAVVTPEARVLVRGNLGDAIEALSGVPGVQINRSCWVAIKAIKELRQDGPRLEITLVTGDHEIVSQMRRIAVQSVLDATAQK